MGFVKRLFGDDGGASSGEDYLDLAQIAKDTPTDDFGTTVKVCEVARYEDVSSFSQYVYQGSAILVDVSHVDKDEILLKRIVNDLRKVATDVRGDVAGVADHLILVTPQGITVDRRKLRVQAA